MLSHEIGHVVQNHMARSVMGEKSSMVAALAGLAVAVLASHSDNPQIAEAAMVSSQAYAAQNQLSMTQAHEKEADRVGLQTMANAGFDPNGMPEFFKNLQSQDRLYESNVPGFLRTHPMTYERMADLQNRVAEMKAAPHVDNPEFALVRARVEASAGDPQDAYKRFSALAEKQDEPASWYGLVLSSMRVGNKEQAEIALSIWKRSGIRPWLKPRTPKCCLAPAESIRPWSGLTTRSRTIPDYKPLAYYYARALLRQSAAAKAEVLR